MSEQITTARMIDLSLVDIAQNVRTSSGLDAESLKELAASIKAHGVLQPVIVTQHADKYLVIAGQRRTLAAKLAKLERIPAIVRSAEENGEDLKAAQIVENLHRENLSLSETCLAVREMLAMVGKPAEVAKRLNKSSAWVSKHLSPTGPSFSEGVRAVVMNGQCNDIETVIILNQIAKHANGGEVAARLVSKAEAGELTRAEARKALDALKAPENEDDDEPGDSDGVAGEPEEKFGKLELAAEPARLLLEALKFAQAKKPSSRPGDALIKHVEAFIERNWPAQQDLPI